MLVKKENNSILIDKWTLNDLFDIDFWKKINIRDSSSDVEYFKDFFDSIKESQLNPIILQRLYKDNLIEFLWSKLVTEHRVSFFENEFTVFYIWAHDIAPDNLIKLHNLIIKNQTNRVPDLISSTSVYKRMVESRNNAHRDMIYSPTSKNEVIMQFYDKIRNEEVISLNTPEYILVSGINEDKVTSLKEKLLNDDKYILISTVNYDIDELDIPIYVFHQKAK